jgi:hypothetical protein
MDRATIRYMEELPKEALGLLSATPDTFVEERTRLARKLRDSGRREDAALVAGFHKPAAVVLAANRAARSRPNIAKEAARAAKRMKSQLGTDPEARQAVDTNLALLEEVALTFLAKEGKSPTDTVRRKLQDLLRNAMADDAARDALARGVLADEPEPAGFGVYAGAKLGRATRSTKAEPKKSADREKQRERERVLRQELESAERRLRDAEDAERAAARERARAERVVESARAKLASFGKRER